MCFFDAVFGVITVVVVLASGDPGDGSTAALDHALRTALGDRAEVLLRFDELHGAPPPDTLVARVEWTEHEKRAVVRTADGTRNVEREIRFDANDEAIERGRTVGFALASMVPDELVTTHPPSPPTPAPIPVIAPAPIVTKKEHLPAPPSPKRHRFSVELLGQGATGTAGGLGGAIGARLPLRYGFAARAAFGLRLGDIPSAQATSRMVTGAIGIGWVTSLNDSFRVGARVDALLLNQYVSHFSADDPEPNGQSRMVPGADARIEGAFRIAESTAVTLGVGPEVTFGTTHIYVGGVETDRIPIARFIGEIGVSVAF